MCTNASSAGSGSTSKVIVHFLGGPFDGQIELLEQVEFEGFIAVSPYKLLDAYSKEDGDHYEVGYNGALTWENS